MTRPSEPESVALATLRRIRTWTAQQLSDATGISTKVISNYETAASPLRRELLDELAGAMGFAPEEVELLLLVLRRGRPGESGETPCSPVEAPPEERRQIQRAAARFGVATIAVTESRLLEIRRSLRARKDRAKAARLWNDLKDRSPADRRLIVESVPEVQTWAMSEGLSLASSKAAAHRADLALELAELGLLVAELAPGEPAWRSRLQGHAWAFIANARRVGGCLPDAEAAFATAWKLWRDGDAADSRLLAEWRLLDMEAALRCAQRRFQTALELHERAQAVAPRQAELHILLNTAFTLEQAGRIEDAVAALREAAPLLDGAGDRRLGFGLRFNLITNLCHLTHYAEAEELLQEVRDLAVSLCNELDLIRVLWLTGRIAAGRGRSEEALAAFKQVSRDFAARGISYDAALVSLERAALLLDQYRTAEVGNLAAEMAWIFNSQKVPREGIAALRLFCQAATAGTATAEMARRLYRFLERARRDPSLRFEET